MPHAENQRSSRRCDTRPGVLLNTMLGFAPLRPPLTEGRPAPRSTGGHEPRRPAPKSGRAIAGAEAVHPALPPAAPLADSPACSGRAIRARQERGIRPAEGLERVGDGRLDASIKPPRRSLLRWLIIAALPLAAWGIHRLGRSPEAGRPAVPSAVITRGNLAVRVLATGRVEPALQAQIRSRVGGVVAEVLVSEGQKVRPGDILLKLDPADHQREVERVAAEVAERSAELRLALQRRGTVRKGLEHRVLAAVEMDTAEAEVSLTRARLKATRVNQKTAHDRLRYATMVAPFAGTIIHRNVQPGEVVAPGMTATMEGRPLLVIGDASRLLIRSELNQIDFARVELGQTARVTFDALSGRVYQATVSALPASSTKGAAGTEVFQVQLELQASDDLAHVKPGMNADVEISIAEKQNVLLLPVEALNAEKAARSVQVWSPTVGRYETRPVQTGEHDDHRVEILNGLSEGDRVLTGSLESSAER